MRIGMLALLLCLTSTAVVAGEEKRPPRPPSQMAAGLTGAASLAKRVPLKLTFVNEAGDATRFANADFAFVLLDEHGVQVKDPFIREAVRRDVVLEGAAPTYEPPLAFDRACKGLQVGKQYQLVCVLPAGGINALAGSVRFTLQE